MPILEFEMSKSSYCALLVFGCDKAELRDVPRLEEIKLEEKYEENLDPRFQEGRLCTSFDIEGLCIALAKIIQV